MRNHEPLKRSCFCGLNKIDIRVHHVPHAYEFNGGGVTQPSSVGVHLDAKEWGRFKEVMSTVEALRNDIKTETACYDKHYNQTSTAYCDYC